MIILERPLSEIKDDDGVAVSKKISRTRSYSSQIIRPEKGLVALPIKGKVEPAVNTIADVGNKQILKSAEAVTAKRPSSAGPTGHKECGDHKESLYSTGVEGSAMLIVSPVYTPCVISLGTEQSEPTTEKEFIAVKTHAKRNVMNRNRAQDTKQEHYLYGQPQKPLSLQKTISPIDNKFEGSNVHQISSMPLSTEDGYLKESTNQQWSISFSVSTDESHKRQRDGSFTGQAEGKTENGFPLLKPSSNYKTQDLHRNTQIRPPARDPQVTGVTSTPAVSAKPRDLTISVSAGQELKEGLANNTQDMVVKTKEGVEEKEEKSSSEVRLYTTSQSEVSVKQYNAEVRNTPWLPETTSSVQKDSKVQPARETCTVPRSPPLYNTELFSTAETPLFSSIQPQSAKRDQERAGLIRFPGKSLFLFYKTPFRNI